MPQTASQDAFQTELVSLVPQLRAFARSLCHNAAQADDLAQDTLAKAWAAQASFTPGTNMKAWTFMILRNLYYSETRRSWRSQPLDPEVAERTLIAVDSPNARLELDELRRAMAMLPEPQREALVLVGAGGFSYEETAQIAGVAVGTVKSRVSRARAMVAKLMEGRDLEPETTLPSEAMGAILSQLEHYRNGGNGA